MELSELKEAFEKRFDTLDKHLDDQDLRIQRLEGFKNRAIGVGTTIATIGSSIGAFLGFHHRP